MNVNLAAMYFSGQEHMGQIEFQKLLAKTLIFNSYYNEEQDKTPDKKCNQQETGHCLIMLPKGKNLLVHKWSKQTANILNINAQPAQRGYAPVAFAPQGSISVQNVSVVILLVPKQSFNTGLIQPIQTPKQCCCSDDQYIFML